MTETNPPKSDRVGNDYSRGPNPNPGGDIDTGDSAVPPYEDRSTETTNSRDVEATTRGGHGGESYAPEPVNPAVSSDAPADAGDFPPEGVGETSGRRGEDIKSDDGKEAGRHDEGTQGQTDRPTGSSDIREGTGI